MYIFSLYRMPSNNQSPWIVESLEDFLHYCCPECNDRNQSRDSFIQHALSNHPNAENYLAQFIVKNEFDDKYDDTTDAKENLKKASNDEEYDPLSVFAADVEPPLDEAALNDLSVNYDNYTINHGEDQKNDDDNNNFKCQHCAKTFPSKISLHNHKYTDHEDDDIKKEYVCSYCEEKFFDNNYLQLHMSLHKSCSSTLKEEGDNTIAEYYGDISIHDDKEEENNSDSSNKIAEIEEENVVFELKKDGSVIKKDQSGKFHCTLCPRGLKSFTTNGSLKLHIKSVHEGQRNHKCDSCGKSFITSSHLKNHIRTVHEGQRNYKCDSCEKYYSEAGHLKRHVQITHEGLKNSYKCDLCGKTYAQKTNLTNHIKIIHQGFKETPTFCELCGKPFAYKTSLKRHLKDVHEGKKQKCDQCEYKCGKPGELAFHVKQVHEKLKYKCHFKGCEESFNTQAESKEHKEVKHAGDQMKYTCEHCGKNYNFAHSFRQHLNKMHSNIKQQCEICGKDFADYWNLRAHVQRVHERIKNHNCETCGKCFASSRDLKSHILHNHTMGKKLYKCGFEKCNESFDKLGELKKHSKTDHAGEVGKFQCDQCDISYNHVRNLRNHMKRIHKGVNQDSKEEAYSPAHS